MVLLPLFAVIWLTAFTDLLYTQYQKKILQIFIIYGIAFEIAFFTMLLIDPHLIGDLNLYFDPDYGLFVRIYQYSLMGFLGITFILFARACMRSDTKETQIKGKLILAAIITFIVGSSIDIFAQAIFPHPLFITLVLIARSIMILTAIEFYGAMVLPKWMKKLFRI